MDLIIRSEMEDLLTRYIPHAPKLGLHVRPSIPRKLRRNAIKDYASEVAERDILALYDNTWLGNAKDGIVFTTRYLVFQNSDFDKPRKIRYGDIVRAEIQRGRLGGAALQLDVNSGHATVTEVMDFGARPKALEYVHRFILEVMLLADEEIGAPAASTNWTEVKSALRRLLDDGKLTQEDFNRIMACKR